MLATIGKSIVVLFAINFVALVAVALVMMGKGYLSREKLAEVAKVMQAEPARLTPADELGPTSQPAEGVPVPITLADRERAMAAVRVELESDIQEVRQLQAIVARARQQLDTDRAAFEAERAAFLQTRDRTLLARREAGLKEALNTYKALKAPQIKGLIANLSEEEVGLVLVGLDARLRSKVIDEFRTPEELERLRKVLKLIRDGVITKSGTGTAEATPS